MAVGKSKNSRQVNQYDKILQENIEAALPGLIKNILHINAVKSEELPDSIQHTKERKPDLLKKITDDKGNTFILHIEFQTKNDADMPFRMIEYLAMLLRMYRITVKQYVIYIGEAIVDMPTTLQNENSFFSYNLIAISSIDYHIFLRASNLEEKLFAILANFGNDSAEIVITKIVSDIIQTAKGDLERERLKNQLRILAQLRTLASTKLEIMEHVSTFFKEENDIFYKVGFEKGKISVVKNLLESNRFTISEIANFAGVTEAFVENVRTGIQK